MAVLSDCTRRRGVRRAVGLASVLFGSAVTAAPASELWFNPRFLADDPAAVADLGMYEQGLEVPPGTWHVDIYVNDQFVTAQDIVFRQDVQRQQLTPCLTRKDLATLGVRDNAVAAATAPCTVLSQLLPAAQAEFDVGQQRLNLTIPQAQLYSVARGDIPPQYWDDGITAGLLNYAFSANDGRSGDGSRTHFAWLNLQSGLNVGPWRLRDNSVWNTSRGQGNASSTQRWQHINSWLERDIKFLRARLTLGDSFSSGDIFDGMNFRGVQLASDDSMLPDSLRGYAPVIRGIARGTAQVIVRQNGYEIYQRTVPPGPFAIDDLYATGGGGDLQVSIIEADGSRQTFTQPWATVPLMQREGHTRYALTAGRFRSGNEDQRTPAFVQTTAMHGLAGGWTLLGGTQLAGDYRAFNAGVVKNLGAWGALSSDVTQANATLSDGSQHSGQSLRFMYSKALVATGTNVQLAGYRYSTSGYYSFSEANWDRQREHHGVGGVMVPDAPLTTPDIGTWNPGVSKRGRLQLSLNQQLGSAASLFITGSRQSYWGSDKTDSLLLAGFNAVNRDISWSVSYSLNKSAWLSGRDQLLAFNLNIPFSHWLPQGNTSAWRQANAKYSASSDLQGRSTQLAGLYGTLLDDRNLTYSLQTGYTHDSRAQAGSSTLASTNWRGGYGNASLGYSQSPDQRQLYYGVSGSVVAHENGLTFGQPANSTVVLVKAPGADHVAVENQTGVTTDWRGYALLPYATEYRENRIALNTDTLANDVDLPDAVVRVVPTHGAVARAEFTPRVGKKVLMTLIVDGKPLPFGTRITAAGGGGIVGDNGQVYLTGLPAAGDVVANWGEDASTRCRAHYQLGRTQLPDGLYAVTATCYRGEPNASTT
ncbi:fimbria/pilus outer membrane usher protein [Pantoea sp. 1.19]|uniref:fimbria/pilus outer membrane usher protein n=1 Tax=Pantoea sp. 1.19 TaxID=1925589 RepID=UPI000948F2AA|nr:fimbria/pilus outer membrane usher protein [Pantoea sp. 1.19]